ATCMVAEHHGIITAAEAIQSVCFVQAELSVGTNKYRHSTFQLWQCVGGSKSVHYTAYRQNFGFIRPAVSCGQIDMNWSATAALELKNRLVDFDFTLPPVVIVFHNGKLNTDPLSIIR